MINQEKKKRNYPNFAGNKSPKKKKPNLKKRKRSSETRTLEERSEIIGWMAVRTEAGRKGYLKRTW